MAFLAIIKVQQLHMYFKGYGYLVGAAEHILPGLVKAKTKYISLSVSLRFFIYFISFVNLLLALGIWFACVCVCACSHMYLKYCSIKGKKVTEHVLFAEDSNFPP